MNFNLVFSTANELYGIEGDSEDFMEIALIAFSKIGNARMKLHKVVAIPNPKDNSVELPCDATYSSFDDSVRIESVTYGFEDYQKMTNLGYDNWPAGIIEHWVEGTKEFNSSFYNSGKFAKFEQVGRKLYFKDNYGPVTIVYRKLITDQDGLPDLTDQEITAIATYIAFVTKQKEAWKTNNAQMLNMAQYMRQQWLKACDQARMPNHISQNEMDQILDSISSYDRKIYGLSYKPIK